MFDISWTEFLLIGIVALIVIGPKELPAVMRSLGQWSRKIRSLAADFQNQFHEAMREAEMADLKKQVDDMASDIKSYDPLKDVRADVEAMGKDLDDKIKRPDPANQVAATEAADAPGSAVAASPAGELPIPQAAAEPRDKEVAAAGIAREAAAESSSSGGGAKPQ